MRALSILSFSALPLLFACSAGDTTPNPQQADANAPADGNSDGVADSLGTQVTDAFDINMDGVIDGPGIDTNNDGVPDAVGIDSDGDGVIDALDTTGDGVVDVVAPPPTGTGGNGTGGTGTVGSGGATNSTGGSGIVSPPSGSWSGAIVAAATTATPSEYAGWHAKYFSDCGNGTACIAQAGECFSEGIGYGMLASVSADDQATFDKLWAFYKKFEDANGLMNWKIQNCGAGEIWGQNAASDGDLDAAYALLQAAARWGGTYGGDATTLITAIKDHETEVCSGRIILRPGDAWGGCSDNNQINPSYFSPAYYRAFAVHVPAQAADWNKMVTDTYDLLDLMQARMNGLIPNWTNADGSSRGNDQHGYESVRTPWRVAVDYGLSADPRAKAVLDKLVTYTSAQGGPGSVPFDANSAFRGTFAVSGIVAQATADSFYNSWIGSSGMDDQPYYQGSLRVLVHQVMGGSFYVP